MIFPKHGNMKFAYRNREFRCKGNYVDTVGKNTKAITEYIADQLNRDKEADRLSIFEPRKPFTGSKHSLPISKTILNSQYRFDVLSCHSWDFRN